MRRERPQVRHDGDELEVAGQHGDPRLPTERQEETTDERSLEESGEKQEDRSVRCGADREDCQVAQELAAR